MKTAEQAAVEYAESLEDNDYTIETEAAYKAGAEFAQRWIPMNEELPLRGIEIILKNKWCKRVFCPNSIGDIKWCSDRFTHWRPIELK